MDFAVYQWINDGITGKVIGEQVQLAPNDRKRLVSGTLVADIVTRKLLKGKHSLLAELAHGVNERNASVENWELLFRVLAKLGLVFNKHTRAAILAGDLKAITLGLHVVKAWEELMGTRRVREPKHRANSAVRSTWLDWVLVIISQHFNLAWRKTAGLVLTQSPDLRQLFIAGYKKKFDRPVAALAQARASVSALLDVLKDQPEWFGFVLALFSGALESLCVNVKTEGLKFYLEVHSNTSKVSQKLDEILNQWILDSGAYQLVVSALSLAPSLAASLLIRTTYIPELILEKIQGTIPQADVLLATVTLLDHCPESHIAAIRSILPMVVHQSLGEQPELSTAGLLCDIWLRHSFSVGSANETTWKVLFFVNKVIERSSVPRKVMILGKLFAITHKHNAAEVFKYLSGIFSESSQDVCLRDFMTENFLSLLTTNPLLDLLPLIGEALTVLSYCQPSISDYQFFLTLSTSSQFEETHALAFLEYFLKDYFETPSRVAIKPITIITTRFIKAPAMQEYLRQSISLHLKSLQLKLINRQDYSLFLAQVSMLLQFIASAKNRAFNKILLSNLCACTKHLQVTLNWVPAELISLLDYFRKKVGLLVSSEKRRSFLTPGASEELYRLKRSSGINTSLRKANSRATPNVRTLSEERRKPLSFNRSLSYKSNGKAARLIKLKTEIEYMKIEDETEFDQSLVYVVLQRYSPVTRALYRHYTSSTKSLTPSSFQRSQCLKMGEACKMLRENSIRPDMISTETLRKLYIVVLSHAKSLNYEAFLNFLYHVAVTVYSRSPLDLSHYPTAISLKALFECIAQNGVYSLKAFSQPIEDPELVKHLNTALTLNEDYPLPAGYKRVTETYMAVDYLLPKVVPRTSTVLCLEVLDSIVHSVFRMHFIEPQITVHTVYRAVPIGQAVTLGNPTKKAVKLTYNLRATLSKLSPFYPENFLLECAKVVDDLIHSVDCQSHNKVYTRNPASFAANQLMAANKQRRAEMIKDRAQSEFRIKHQTSQLFQSLKARKEQFFKQPTLHTAQFEQDSKRYSPSTFTQHTSFLKRASVPRNVGSQAETSLTQALSERGVTQLWEAFSGTYAALIKAYSSEKAMSPLHCSLFGKDVGIVPGLLDSVLFNRLVKFCCRSGSIDTMRLHWLMIRVALSVRTQLEGLLDRKLTTVSDTYAGLLEYLRLPQDPRQLGIF